MKRPDTLLLGVERLRRWTVRLTFAALVAGCGTAAPSSEDVGQVRQATGLQKICISTGACYSYHAAAPLTLYVAPAPSGSNSWTGALPASNGTDGPLATFEGARLVVQKLTAALTSAGASTAISVQFRGGTYYLPQDPLLAANLKNPSGPYGEILTAADSGSSSIPITYEAYPGVAPTETPIFSGGLPVSSLPGSVWTNPSQDGITWQVTLPETVGPATAPVDIQPFENIYYNPQSSGTPFGQRRLRPRVGGVVTGSPADSTSYLHVAAPILTSDPNAAGCSVAPGSTQCMDRFYYNQDDLGSLGWGDYSCPGGPGSSPPSPGDVELVAFELWTAAKQRIRCIDKSQNVLYLTGPIWQGGGPLPNAYGYVQNHRYFIENLKSALSKRGQWSLDTSASRWVLTYLSQANESPPTDTVVIPQLKQVLVASGLQSVTFKGLNFAHDNYIVPSGGFNNTTEAPAAVSFQNTTAVLFDSGSVSQTSGTGLEVISCFAAPAQNASGAPGWCYQYFSGNTSTNVVQNSAFWDLGSHGIRIGDDAASSDTPTNVASSNRVQNNVISGYGRVFPDSNGINQGTGNGNVYQQNTIFDGYKGAIRVRYVSYLPDNTNVFPSSNVIQYNLVYKLFQGIMNDGGSLYFGVGSGNGTGSGNVIRYNVVHDVTDSSILDADGYGGDGLYADEWTGDVSMTSNLVYRVSGSAVTFAGPHPWQTDSGPCKTPAKCVPVSAVTNNIFAYARTSMIATADPYDSTSSPPIQPPASLFFKAWDNIFYFDRDASSTNPCVYSLPCEYTNAANSNPFYVQGGMAYPGSVTYAPPVLDSYNDFEQWSSNTYFRRPDSAYGVTGDLASDPSAFHTENPTVNPTCEANYNCMAMTIAQATVAAQWPAVAPTWNLYSFAGWQGLGEDAGSVVEDPHFKTPTWPADDYSFPDGPPANFAAWTYTTGASGGAVPPYPVLPGFPTASYDPATDF